MTTLFPQIKRVDEDETSKIIKNVLFDDQDDAKLEQILDEFMHLTEGSITHSDDESDDDEDDDDDDDDDDADDDDDDDDDEDDDDNDNEDNDDDDVPREPTSWNLDQFMKIPVRPPKETNSSSPTTPIQPKQESKSNHVSKLPKSPNDTNSPSQTTPIQPKQESKSNHVSKLPKSPNDTNSSSPTTPIQPKHESKSNHVSKQPKSPNHTNNNNNIKANNNNISVNNDHNHHHNNNLYHVSAASTGSSASSLSSHTNNISSSNNNISKKGYIVSIDLSKLKRIPKLKQPNGTTTSTSIMIAKALKHEADAERDKTKQAMKYLESAMYFVLHGHELETSTRNYTYYHDTIPLFKHALRLTMPSNDNQQPDNMTNFKIYSLGLRCLSLLYMKLYKIRERELNECAKLIGSQEKSPPSPISQDVSLKASVYTAYKRQLSIYNYLRHANDYWQQADQFCDQHPSVKIFFSTIESNCGALTMISQFTKLMDHVKCGLKLLRS